MDAATPATIVLGRITSVAPGKREARARITPGITLDTAALGWAWFEREGARTRYKVLKAGASDGELRLVFAPGVPMDTVRGLQGATVAVETTIVLSHGPLWRRVREMVGLEALTEDGTRIGSVLKAFGGPKTGAVKVESDDGTVWIVPVIEETVLALDVERGVVVLGDFEPYAMREGENEEEDVDAD